jgi:hypothetical protein
MLLVAACAVSKPAQRPVEVAHSDLPPAPPPVAELPPEPPPAPPTSMVKGLTGTLNKDDVHQTMDERQSAFDACIDMSRRSLRLISGAIRFAFKVNADGTVQEVHATESTIGHRALEECLSAAVASTQFPKPAGAAAATFDWGMQVEPAGKPPDELDAEVLKNVLKRHTREVHKTCQMRRRERFRVTAYIGPGGRVISSGAVAMPARAEEKVDCVLEQVASWHMPKLDRSGKVSFDVR